MCICQNSSLASVLAVCSPALSFLLWWPLHRLIDFFCDSVFVRRLRPSGDGERGGKDTSVCRHRCTHTHTHTHRAAVLAGPLFPLLQPQTCIGDILQYTFYEPFPSHQCSRSAQLSVGESYGVVFSRLRRTDPTPRRRRTVSLIGLRALGV